MVHILIKTVNFSLSLVQTLRLCLLVVTLFLLATVLILFSWPNEPSLQQSEKSSQVDTNPDTIGQRVSGKECPIPTLIASSRSLQDSWHVQRLPDCRYERLFSKLEGNDTVSFLWIE